MLLSVASTESNDFIKSVIRVMNEMMTTKNSSNVQSFILCFIA